MFINFRIFQSVFIYSKGGGTGRQGETGRERDWLRETQALILHPKIQCSNDCNDWGWTRQKPMTWDHFKVWFLRAGTGPFLLHLQADYWTAESKWSSQDSNGADMGYYLKPLDHNAKRLDQVWIYHTDGLNISLKRLTFYFLSTWHCELLSADFEKNVIHEFWQKKKKTTCQCLNY